MAGEVRFYVTWDGEVPSLRTGPYGRDTPQEAIEQHIKGKRAAHSKAAERQERLARELQAITALADEHPEGEG